MSAALERVIAEQQERIDRLEKQDAAFTENSKREFERYRDLFSALSSYKAAAERMIDFSAISDRDRAYFYRCRDDLRAKSWAVGYCWRCEHYGCVCDMDCGCD